MPSSQRYRLVKVMGERGSGTNFLQQIIKLNFRGGIVPNTTAATGETASFIKSIPREKRRPRLMADRVLEYQHISQMAENAGWKHACLTDAVFEVFERAEETLFLCILRHPALWLRSLLDKPFHNFNRDPSDLDELIETPWMTRSCDEIPELMLASPVLLWRLKTESYLQQAARRRNVMVVQHEKLLADHGTVLRGLSEVLTKRMQLGWKVPKGYGRSWLRESRAGEDFWTIRDALPDDPFSVLTASQAGKVRALIGTDLLAHAGYGEQV